MNILVCIKAVPASTKVNLDEVTNTLIRTGIENVINPFDSYALDLALRLKEKYQGRVDVLSMGIPETEQILHHAYSLGVDKVTLLTDRALAGADTLATSYSLASTIKTLGQIDLVLCGKQSTDGDTAQVGPEIAEMLNYPHSTYITDILLAEDKSHLVVKRRTSEKSQTILIDLPAVLTVVKGMHIPKLPTLEKYLGTLDKKVDKITSLDLSLDTSRIGLLGSPTQVVNVFTPNQAKRKKMILGSLDEQAEKLLEILKFPKGESNGNY